MEVEIKTGTPSKCSTPSCENMITKGYRYLTMSGRNKYGEPIKLKYCTKCSYNILTDYIMKANSMLLQLRITPKPVKHRNIK